ncbi:MAG: RES family NAD+ phosphorylase [Bacteroidia bacterium]|nr:RES family NAD+ phosphorylase [Bacteroidia bacterium]
MEKNQINFKVYSKAKYDRIMKDLLDISKTWGPKKISNYIRKNFSITFMPILPLPQDAIEKFPFYRVRVWNENDTLIDESNPKSFSYPPKKFMGLGRANRKGMQVLYGAGDEHTAFHEKKKEITQGKSIVYLIKWGIKKEVDSVLMRSLFLGISTEKDSYAAIMSRSLEEGLKEHFEKWPTEAKKLFLYGQKKYNDLFCVEGNQYYHITSSMTYDTFVLGAKQNVHIPIVAYPSVSKDKSSVNFVIRKDFVDKNMYIKEVQKLVVKKFNNNKIETSLIAKGELIDNKIRWKKIKATLKEINYDSVKIILNFNQESLRNLEQHEKITLCCKNHEMSLKDYLDKNNINENTIMTQLPNTEIVTNDKKLPMIVSSVIVAPTEGNLYVSNKIMETEKISHLIIPFTYSVNYELVA